MVEIIIILKILAKTAGCFLLAFWIAGMIKFLWNFHKDRDDDR